MNERGNGGNGLIRFFVLGLGQQKLVLCDSEDPFPAFIYVAKKKSGQIEPKLSGISP